MKFSFNSAYLLSAIGILGLAVAPVVLHLRDEPIYGSTVCAVMIVLMGGIFGTICWRLFCRSHHFLHQFLGAFLVAIIGIAMPGIVPLPGSIGQTTAYVLAFVYAGGVCGAIIGGMSGAAITRFQGLTLVKWRQCGPTSRVVIAYMGATCVALTAIGTAAIVVSLDQLV